MNLLEILEGAVPIQFLLVALIISGIVGVLVAMRYHTRHVAALLDVHTRAVLAAIVEARAPIRHGPVSIMVVEDDAPTLRMVTAALTHAGYAVRPKESAEAALAGMVSNGLPELILLDMRLPEMSGLELARQLRHVGCRMPIIAYSASTEPSLGQARRSAIDAGCNAFVAKSGNLDGVLRVVAQWLALGATVR